MDGRVVVGGVAIAERCRRTAAALLSQRPVEAPGGIKEHRRNCGRKDEEEEEGVVAGKIFVGSVVRSLALTVALTVCVCVCACEYMWKLDNSSVMQIFTRIFFIVGSPAAHV